MKSDNPSSAVNQQERLEIFGWLVGLTDGEGAFTVSILKNSPCKLSWQVFPEFIVTQGAKSKDVLNLFKEVPGCENIYLNRRFDSHTENIYRYCVRSIGDLWNKVVPFYKEHPLKTHKEKDFNIFCSIMEFFTIKSILLWKV